MVYHHLRLYLGGHGGYYWLRNSDEVKEGEDKIITSITVTYLELIIIIALGSAIEPGNMIDCGINVELKHIQYA